MKALRIKSLSTIAFVLLGGCTWVELNTAGQLVKQLTNEQLTPTCERVGVVNASTKASIVAGTSRNEKKIQQELTILARNEAGTLNANAIVAKTPAIEGKQSFIAYRCP
ncbi:DUF4156 domain-containing protein [Eionea flava]